MDKVNVVDPHNEILFSNKKESINDTVYIVDELQKHVKWKKRDTRDYIYIGNKWLPFIWNI